MYFLWAGKARDEMKTIKSEFGGPVRQLISPWRSSQEATQEEEREKPHWSLSNSIPPPPPQHVRNLCPPPAPGGAGKLSLGVFYTAAASRLAESFHWLSTASLKGTWQISRRRKNTEGGEEKKKSILSSHAPLGAKATSGILKDAGVDRI